MKLNGKITVHVTQEFEIELPSCITGSLGPQQCGLSSLDLILTPTSESASFSPSHRLRDGHHLPCVHLFQVATPSPALLKQKADSEAATKALRHRQNIQRTGAEWAATGQGVGWRLSLEAALDLSRGPAVMGSDSDNGSVKSAGGQK
jgi:hypothetical protein